MTNESKENRPAFSVIIPTYNGKDLLEKHLPAVLKMMEPKDELLIIDDASSDDTEEWFREWKQTLFQKEETSIPSIRYIQNITNLRFAATVNKAVYQVTHDYFLLLNNDVAPSKKLLDTVWSFRQQQHEPENIFAIGCKEIEGDDENVIGGRNLLWFERGMFIHSRHPEMESGETAWASGGSSVFDTKKWLEIGGFDRRFYPAYWEDIDLSVRAKKEDWKVLFCKEALVHHHHETTNATVFGQRKIALMSWKNAYIFAWQHMTKQQWVQHILWMFYHQIITGYKTKGLPTIALFQAIFSN